MDQAPHNLVRKVTFVHGFVSEVVADEKIEVVFSVDSQVHVDSVEVDIIMHVLEGGVVQDHVIAKINRRENVVGRFLL